MSAENPASEHVDTQGCRRQSNRWGFNSFVTREDAERYARETGRGGARWYIWRLPDGTFDYTATAEPKWFRDLGIEAEMVGQIP